MTSSKHEGLVALFRNRPTLAPKVLADALEVSLPAYTEAEVKEADFTQQQAVEFRADLVVVLQPDAPVYGIVVEVQLVSKEDKRYTWPVYAAALRARLRAPVCVLVVAPDPSVAEWAARPIALGAPGSVFVPMVLGPPAVPEVVDLEEALADPEMAVLSAMAHGGGSRGLEIAAVTLEAIRRLDDERARLYYDLVAAALPAAARQALEELMANGTYEYQTEFARKYVAQGLEQGREQGLEQGLEQGKKEGSANTLLRLMARRFGILPEETRARVLAASQEELDRWADALLDATSLEAVFAGADEQ